MKILSIVGTRPQLIKLLPIQKTFSASSVQHEYINTGQHYDSELDQEIAEDLGLLTPLLNLGIGSGSHADQTARMLVKIEQFLIAFKPDGICVYGDTNSTLAGALTGSKLKIPVFHVEAGLRSFNRTMPEELNRRVVDTLSDRLYAPTNNALTNLKNENLLDRSILTGDVMLDLQKIFENNLNRQNILDRFGVEKGNYFVATVHRAENTDHYERLKRIFDQFSQVSDHILLFAHPRLLKALRTFDIQISNNIFFHQPVSWSTINTLSRNSRGVITDSGGLQKEAFMMGILCTTLRNETEWIETLESNWNLLWNMDDLISECIYREVPTNQPFPFGDGKASVKIVEDILNFF